MGDFVKIARASYQKGLQRMTLFGFDSKHQKPISPPCFELESISVRRHLLQTSSIVVGVVDNTNRPFAQSWPGDEVRVIAGEIRLGCACFSLKLSFLFCFGMSFSDHCCVPRFFNEAGVVLHSSLMVFNGQVSSGSAGYLPLVRLIGRTSASPTTLSYALSTSSLQQIFAFMLVPKSLWTLPSPVL